MYFHLISGIGIHWSQIGKKASDTVWSSKWKKDHLLCWWCKHAFAWEILCSTSSGIAPAVFRFPRVLRPPIVVLERHWGHDHCGCLCSTRWRPQWGIPPSFLMLFIYLHFLTSVLKEYSYKVNSQTPLFIQLLFWLVHLLHTLWFYEVF